MGRLWLVETEGLYLKEKYLKGHHPNEYLCGRLDRLVDTEDDATKFGTKQSAIKAAEKYGCKKFNVIKSTIQWRRFRRRR